MTQPLEQPAIDATNRFGIAMYRALSKELPGRNLFLSPYSLAVALTMVAEGARGETASEMARVLHFSTESDSAQADGFTGPSPRTITNVHEGFASLARGLRSSSGDTSASTSQRLETLRLQLDEANRQARANERQQHWSEAQESARRANKLAEELNALLRNVNRFELRAVNALWVEKVLELVPSYVETIERFYGSDAITRLNIVGDPEGARRRINGWVEDNTNQRIKDLVPEGSPDARNCLVITTAVYFKGEWVAPFAENSTRDEDFTIAGGEKIQVKMMHDSWRKSVSYAAFAGDGTVFRTPTMVPTDEAQWPQTYPDDAGFSMIELPYKGEDLSMVVIAPRSPGGLARLEGLLTGASLDSWLSHLERRTVDTAMPRFKVEAAYEMSRDLKDLGMKRAFLNPLVAGGAQFPGISVSLDPARQLYIGGVHHKAWVEVTEKGTEAAAATALMMEAAAAMPSVEMVRFIPKFRADRPFLFFIRDAKKGIILFMGRIIDPR